MVHDRGRVEAVALNTAWQEKPAADEIVVIYGGMGAELQRRGGPTTDEAWSGSGAHTHGATVCAIHEDYIRAGAEVIVTNTSRLSGVVYQ